MTLPTLTERNVIQRVAMAIALACWSCSPQPDLATVYIPETAGLVRHSEVVGQDYRLTFEDGRTLTFPVNGNLIQGKQLRAGTVVVAGTKPVPWVFSADLRPAHANAPPGCYQVLGRAQMDGTYVFQRVADDRGEVVMAFPKTGDWGEVGVYTDGSGDLAGAGTCINPLGRAFQWIH